jgi:hypothetical protein
MYDKTRVKTAAISLVGIRQDSNSIYSGLSAALKASTSGYYINDLSMVSLELLNASMSKDAVSANAYLTNVFESTLYDIVDRFVNRVKSELNSKELLGNQSIVAGVAPFTDKVTQNARAVGYWIRPHRGNNLKIQIKQLGFQAALQASPVRVYLYDTSKLAPITSYDFAIGTSWSVLWNTVNDFLLTYQSLAGGTGQDFLLLYYEADTNNPQTFQLQGQALTMSFDCGCSASPKSKYGKYMNIWPVEFGNSVLNWNAAASRYDIPLVQNVASYITNKTYGLLAKVNVTCDITDVLVHNIQMFAKPLQHAIAERMLMDAYATLEINSLADGKRADIMKFALKYGNLLNGYNVPDGGGRVKGLIDTLTMDFSGLDKYCLPCKEDGITRSRLTRG